MAHPVSQWQILTTEPEKHSAFYSSVFGWTIRSDNPLGYRMAETGSTSGISGGFWPAPPEARPFVQLFIEVADAADTVQKVTDHGGRVLIPPQVLPGGDQMAILMDPMGVSFGIVVPARS